MAGPTPDNLGAFCWAARHRLPGVRIDEAALEALGMQLAGAAPPRWDHPAWPAQAGPALDAVVVLGNALNFSYWVDDHAAMWTWPVAGRPEVDAFALFGRLTAAWTDGLDLADARVLQSAEIIGLFEKGSGTLPLIPERVAFLHSLGSTLARDFGGRLENALTETDALAFATALATRFPTAFEDAPMFEGQPVPLRKRAQLAAGMLHAARLARGAPGLGAPERLTLYADYMLPRTLRAHGVLVLDPALAQRIDAGQLIEPDSPEEVALRLATVAAGHALTQQSGLEAWVLDYALWRAGFGVTTRHHRTRTTAY